MKNVTGIRQHKIGACKLKKLREFEDGKLVALRESLRGIRYRQISDRLPRLQTFSGRQRWRRRSRLIWQFDIEGGATALLYDVEAEALQITRFRKAGCRNLRICRFADRASHPPSKKHCKFRVFMRNAAKRRFWDHTMGGGGGGVVANREPGSYIYIYTIIYVYIIAPDSGMRNADEIITYNYCHSNCGGGGPDQVVVSDWHILTMFTMKKSAQNPLLLEFLPKTVLHTLLQIHRNLASRIWSDSPGIGP